MLYLLDVTNRKTTEHRTLWIESISPEDAQYAALRHALHEWAWQSSSCPKPAEIEA